MLYVVIIVAQLFKQTLCSSGRSCGQLSLSSPASRRGQDKQGFHKRPHFPTCCNMLL